MTRTGRFLGQPRALPKSTRRQIEWTKLDRTAQGAQFAFTLELQQELNWCWVAVTQAVRRAVTTDMLTQQVVATLHINRRQPGTFCQAPGSNGAPAGNCRENACTATCNSPHLVTAAMLDAGLPVTVIAEGRVVRLAEITKRIASQRPVVLRLEAQGIGHFVCVTGWWKGPDGSTQLLVHDPKVGVGGVASPRYIPMGVVTDDYPMGLARGVNTHAYASD